MGVEKQINRHKPHNKLRTVEVNICKWRQARESVCEQVTIGFWFRYKLVDIYVAQSAEDQNHLKFK